MQTKITSTFMQNANGKRADKILRACVHCGFCLPTCPTYQLTGDELDSPRGRIYLIKSALEGEAVSQKSLNHLDRCLTCRACETTCPSGVEYGQLLGIGRDFIEFKRAGLQKLLRFVLRKFLTTPSVFNPFALFFKVGKISTKALANSSNKKAVALLFSGCVQDPLAPNINHSASNVLKRLGYNVISTEQKECCGAIDCHLSAELEAKCKAQKNITKWSKILADGGIIITTASGCGLMLKDYPALFQVGSVWHTKALKIAAKTYDIVEILLKQDLQIFTPEKVRLSYHSPCTLQHGQKLAGSVESLLVKLGYQLTPVADSHLCCGSAGTYSIFQPKLAKALRQNKLKQLQKTQPEVIVTSNIGCLMHLAKGSKTPVKHWIELLDQCAKAEK